MSDETNGNGSAEFSVIAQLLPGAVANADDLEEVVPLLTPDKKRPVMPDGTVINADVVFGLLDGATIKAYHRTAKQHGRRGESDYDYAVIWLFQRKCKRIIGLDGDPLLRGMTPMDYFVKDKSGNALLNIAVGEYIQRQVGSAQDSSKSS